MNIPDATGNSIDRAQTAYRLLAEVRPYLKSNKRPVKELVQRIDTLLAVVAEKNGR